MPQIKPHIESLYRSRANKRKGYLRLDMNEGVPGLPDNFLRRVITKVSADLVAMYPEYDSLTKKIAKYNQLNPENICLANGSDAAIKYIFDAYVSVRDRVLLTSPAFAMYPVYCEMFNARPIIIEYKEDLSFPFDDFISVISHKIKLAVIVNPNNPTGSVLKEEKLLKIIKKTANNDVLLIVDEAYFYFYPHSVIRYIRKYKNLIVLRTFSKLLGIASLRLGYAVACPAIIENLRKVKPTFDVNGLAALFAEEILDNSAIIKEMIKKTGEGKKYLIEKLGKEDIEYKMGYTNSVLIKCYNRVDEIIGRLKKKHILVSGNFKQDFLSDYIRISMGDKKNMQKFWRCFIDIWKNQND